VKRTAYSCHAILRSDRDGGVLATFADVPEAITHGYDRNDAIRNAREALAVALFGYLKEGRKLPTRSGDRVRWWHRKRPMS
jgi:antitoxin HicB